uniref:Uncharacterized protein n=1 Tax=Glypta fumiferanae TaxID=389681 RepID=A0A0F6Q8C6_9HYME|nr:hypothetical protein [Glypta fumiferanae]
MIRSIGFADSFTKSSPRAKNYNMSSYLSVATGLTSAGLAGLLVYQAYKMPEEMAVDVTKKDSYKDTLLMGKITASACVASALAGALVNAKSLYANSNNDDADTESLMNA